MLPKAFITDLAYTFFSVLKPGAILLNSTQLLPSHLPDRAMDIIHNRYHAASQYVAHAAPWIANLVGVRTPKLRTYGDQQSLIPTQSVDREPAIDQEVTNTSWEPKAMLGYPICSTTTG